MTYEDCLALINSKVRDYKLSTLCYQLLKRKKRKRKIIIIINHY